MNKRIMWLDGLKGLACIGVLAHHFLVAFLPATYYGDVNMSKLQNQGDVLLSQAPYAFFINGNYMVALFCLVSALVLGLKIMNLEKKQDVADMFIKRYPRLMLPIVPIIFSVYLMLKYECFAHLQTVSLTQSPWLGAFYLEKVSFKRCIDGIFVTTWYTSDSTFSNAFWMLGSLFFGSMLAMILSMFTWKIKRNAVDIIYVFCILIYIRVNTLQLAFVLGVLLAHLYKERKGLFHHRWIGMICLLLGIFLGGYPSGVMPTNIYRYLNFLPPEISAFQLWHIFGAFFTVYGLWNLVYVCKVLECRFMQFLGKISYAIYLIHIPLLFSGSCYVFNRVMELERFSYLKSVGITFIFTMLCVLVLAYFYNRYVEGWCNKWLNMLLKKISVEEKDI